MEAITKEKTLHKGDNEFIAEAEKNLAWSLKMLKHAEAAGCKQFTIMQYRRIRLKRKNFFADLLHGPIVPPGYDDGVANIVMLRLLAEGYSSTKEVSRAGMTKIIVHLPHHSSMSHANLAHY